MSRLLALEWDAREARWAVGRTTGKGVVVEWAQAIDLTDAAGGERGVGERLAMALAEAGAASEDALVAVPRGKTELRVLQVPPAPDDELPELVRFQAMRQFSSLGDDWPLDFVRLDASDEEQVHILAAAVSPQVVAEIQETCTACQTAPTRLVLRPFATASLFLRHHSDGRCWLLVEVLPEEVDLTVVVNGQVIFLRSVRLSAEELAEPLLGEIRRTIAAAHHQLTEHRIQTVVLVGSPDQFASLRDRLSEQLEQPIELFDPLAGVDLAPSVRSALPQHPGRFAALLGMLCDEAEARPHGIDFLNPRRKPEPPDPRKRYALIAAAAAAVLLISLGMLRWYLGTFDEKIRTLRAQSQELDADVESTEKIQADVAEIDRFQAGNINWLDELHELAVELPSAEKAIVDQATFTTRPNGGGQIVLDGYVNDPSVIESMEAALRDERHDVYGEGTERDERQVQYVWHFKEQVNVAPPKIEGPNHDE